MFSKIVLRPLFLSLLLAGAAFNHMALADDRDTGVEMRPPAPVQAGPDNAGDAPKAADLNPASPEEADHPVVPIHRAETIPAGSEMTRAESFGPRRTPKDGSFGIDMWDGSERANIVSLIPQVPDSFTYRTTAALVRRVLTTNADVSLLGRRSADEPGHDLLSIRIRKLMDMGMLDDAAALYKDNPVEPFDPQMAATGMLAILYSGQPSLACLETNALKERFGATSFWHDMEAFCSNRLAHLAGNKNAGTENKENDKDARANADPLFHQLLAHDDFRYTIKSVKDLEALTPFDKAALVNDRRMDYSQISKSDLVTLSPATLALLARDPSAPLDLRFALMLRAVRQGISTSDDLANFYKAVVPAGQVLITSPEKVPDAASVKDVAQLAWLYKSTDAAHGQIDRTALQTVLALREQFGLTALWPFASLMEEANPEGFSGDSIRTGVLLGLLTEKPVSKAWMNQWRKIETTQKSDLLMQAAYEISTNSAFESTFESKDFSSTFKGLNKNQQNLLKMLLEKLDKLSKLHNITLSEVYENPTDLTMADGYVMPSKGLVDNLKTAVIDRRLGEVILLSSIGLHGVPPDKMNAGLLREVLDGYETVGLTKETREFATEVILGLGK